MGDEGGALWCWEQCAQFVSIALRVGDNTTAQHLGEFGFIFHTPDVTEITILTNSRSRGSETSRALQTTTITIFNNGLRSNLGCLTGPTSSTVGVGQVRCGSVAIQIGQTFSIIVLPVSIYAFGISHFLCVRRTSQNTLTLVMSISARGWEGSQWSWLWRWINTNSVADRDSLWVPITFVTGGLWCSSFKGVSSWASESTFASMGNWERASTRPSCSSWDTTTRYCLTGKSNTGRSVLRIPFSINTLHTS